MHQQRAVLDEHHTLTHNALLPADVYVQRLGVAVVRKGEKFKFTRLMFFIAVDDDRSLVRIGVMTQNLVTWRHLQTVNQLLE